MKEYIRKTSCRVCGGRDLTEILDLEAMPPANAFRKKIDLDKPQKHFPLRVYFCHDCSLVQLLDRVHPKYLFSYYDYMTSASKPLSDYFVELGRLIVKRFVRSKKDLVVEIGGNDAVLLSSIADSARVLNVEPAKNIAKISQSKNVPTLNNFFSTKLAKQIVETYGHAAVVTASNVVAHIDDLDDLFEGVKVLIKDKGVFICEVHWVGNLIGEGGFDQIYHEHLSYFSLLAFKKIAERMGLKVFDAEITPNHGATLRVFMSESRKPLPSVEALLEKEKSLGLHKLSAYKKFAEKVMVNRKELQALFAKIKKENKTIVGYGMPAKGNTLLNFCGADHTIIDFIIDTTPFKQGLFTPGGHIPVFPPEVFRDFQPDYTLLLAWNYSEFIIKKETEYRKKGGKFIIPVPRVRIL